MPEVVTSRIPLAALITLLIQAAAGIWFASTIVSDVRHNVTELARHETRINSLEDAVHQQALSSVAIERSVENIEALVERALRNGD